MDLFTPTRSLAAALGLVLSMLAVTTLPGAKALHATPYGLPQCVCNATSPD